MIATSVPFGAVYPQIAKEDLEDQDLPTMSYCEIPVRLPGREGASDRVKYFSLKIK